MIGWGVKGLVVSDEKFLVLVKPDGGMDLPGGRMEPGETFKESLFREITEETALDVQVLHPISEWSFLKEPRVVIRGLTFLCRYLNGKVDLSDEHRDFLWADTDQLNRLGFSRNFGVRQIFSKVSLKKISLTRLSPVSGWF
jgi:8-oxo-dGTP diphosphatase